jgi:hypothetical protein
MIAFRDHPDDDMLILTLVSARGRLRQAIVPLSNQIRGSSPRGLVAFSKAMPVTRFLMKRCWRGSRCH